MASEYIGDVEGWSIYVHTYILRGPRFVRYLKINVLPGIYRVE